MKKLSFFLAGLLLFSFTSCQRISKDYISGKAIVKLCNQELKKQADVNAYYVLNTGYYEENGEIDRLLLQKLAANDWITFKCDTIRSQRTITSSEKYLKGYDWWGDPEYGYRQVQRTVDRISYFVTVDLTSKGKGFVVKEKDEPIEEEDILDVEIDTSKFPEENITLPSEKELIDAVEEVADEVIVEDNEWEGVVEGNNADVTKYPYDIAKEKENKVEVILPAYSIKAIKARNIKISSASGSPEATCEVIIEVINSTPVGRIFFHVYEGQRIAEDVTLHYFIDKGWVIDLE